MRIILSAEDITMFNNIIEQVEEMFRELKKTNPRWEAGIKANASRPVGYNNANNISSSNNGSSPNFIPAGPKRAREDDEEREKEREKERLDRELDREVDNRRESWEFRGPRQQQFNRNRNVPQFNAQRAFADQGYGSRLDNPTHDNKRRR